MGWTGQAENIQHHAGRNVMRGNGKATAQMEDLAIRQPAGCRVHHFRPGSASNELTCRVPSVTCVMPAFFCCQPVVTVVPERVRGTYNNERPNHGGYMAGPRCRSRRNSSAASDRLLPDHSVKQPETVDLSPQPVLRKV